MIAQKERVHASSNHRQKELQQLFELTEKYLGPEYTVAAKETEMERIIQSRRESKPKMTSPKPFIVMNISSE